MADWETLRKSCEQTRDQFETMLVKVNGGDPAPKAPTNGKSGSHKLTQALAKGAERREKLLALQGRVDVIRKRYMRRG